MAQGEPPIEPDQEPGVAHPRLRFTLFGLEGPEDALAAGLAGRRLHHAWLLVGPKGVGKATLAYRFARRALGGAATGPRPLDVSPEDPIARRIAAQTHPDFLCIHRKLGERGRPKREIAVDDVRALGGFFALKPGLGGRRVALIDSVDELNAAGANALLKGLEEPPAESVLILLAHNEGAILPTIRSRCRLVRVRAPGQEAVQALLSAEEVAPPSAGLMDLAQGRPGRALAFCANGIEKLIDAARPALAAFSREGGQALWPLAFLRDGQGAVRLDIVIELVQLWLQKGVLAAIRGESADPFLAAQAAAGNAGAWAQAYQALDALRAEADRLDMDAQHACLRISQILDQARRDRP